MEAMADQLKKFISDHPHEIVLVDVNHIYVQSDKKETLEPSAEHHKFIISRLIDAIGRDLIFDRKFPPHTLFKELIKSKHRVMLVYGGDNQEGDVPETNGIWDSSCIISKWPNTPQSEMIFGKGAMEVSLRKKSIGIDQKYFKGFHVTQLVQTVFERKTEDSKLEKRIPAKIENLLPGTLLKCSENILSATPGWLLEMSKTYSGFLSNLNIVMTDNCRFNEYSIVSAVRKINKMKIMMNKRDAQLEEQKLRVEEMWTQQHGPSESEVQSFDYEANNANEQNASGSSNDPVDKSF